MKKLLIIYHIIVIIMLASLIRMVRNQQPVVSTNTTTIYPARDGKSAYQQWLDAGNLGTEQEFMDTLKGEAGSDSVSTQTTVIEQLPPEKGDTGATGAPGSTGGNGSDGQSAYDLAVSQGYEGSLGEWLDSLTGADAPFPEFSCSTLGFWQYRNVGESLWHVVANSDCGGI